MAIFFFSSGGINFFSYNLLVQRYPEHGVDVPSTTPKIIRKQDGFGKRWQRSEDLWHRCSCGNSREWLATFCFPLFTVPWLQNQKLTRSHCSGTPSTARLCNALTTGPFNSIMPNSLFSFKKNLFFINYYGEKRSIKWKLYLIT